MPGKPEEKTQRSAKIIVSILMIIFSLITVMGYFAVNSDTPSHNTNVPDNFDEQQDNTQIGDTCYLRLTPLLYPNGTQVYVTENPDSADPSFGLLSSLLRDDPTEHAPYGPDYVCTNYAVKLYRTAELSGINAHLVLVQFADQGPPHAIVAFNTTDSGMIFVDDTGMSANQKERGLMDTDRLVEPVPGQPYKSRFLPPFDELQDKLNLGVVSSVEFLT